MSRHGPARPPHSAQPGTRSSPKKQGKGPAEGAGLPSGSKTSGRQIAFALLAILLVYFALRLPGIHVPLDRDEGAFGYMGQLIDEGKLPYRDGLDHKPPVPFYINALALRFVPPTELGIHLFLQVYNLLTLACVFYTGKIYLRSPAAGLWCGFAYAVFSASPAIQGFTASTEMWMLLPIALSLLLSVQGLERNRAVFLFLSGIAGAAACWTKPTAFTSVLFVLAFVAVTSFRSRENATVPPLAARVRAIGSWILGAALFSAVLMLYFYLKGIFHEFVYWSLVHNFLYAGQAPFGESLDQVLDQMIELFRGDFLILGAGVIVGAWRLAQRRSEGYFLLGFLVFSILGTIPGLGYRHYLAQLAPAAALAGGYAIFTLLENLSPGKQRLAATIAAGLVIVAVPVGVNRQYFLESDPNKISRHYFGDNPFPESKPLAAFVAAESSPSDPVFIIGSEPQILFYSRRNSPSSFLMMYPLTASYPRYREFQQSVWQQVQASPPKFILKVDNIPYSILWDKLADLDLLRRLDALLRESYSLSRVMIVTGSLGEWVDPGDSRLKEGAPCVYIFKRRS